MAFTHADVENLINLCHTEPCLCNSAREVFSDLNKWLEALGCISEGLEYKYSHSMLQHSGDFGTSIPITTSYYIGIIQLHLDSAGLKCGLILLIRVTTDHLTGKPGNVREFGACQANVGDAVNSQGNVREKNFVMEKCPKTVHY